MKRLIKAYDCGFTFPAPILVKDYQDKFVNDDINSITYAPNISREYNIFEKEYENIETSLLGGNEKMKDKWVEAFIEALKQDKMEKQADIEQTDEMDNEMTVENIPEEDVIDKEAEINVKDLPKVIWNEEEYGVLFKDDGTAELFNDFGNHIITLYEVYTIDEVNAKLGDKQITPKNLSAKVKSFIKIAEDLQQELLNAKQQYARIDGFTEPEYDIALEEYNDMLKSIEKTTNQIMKEHNVDNTTRSEVYYVPLTDEDTDLFKEVCCPYCGEYDTMVKTTGDGEKQYIKCENCGAEYEVNCKTGEIYYVSE